MHYSLAADALVAVHLSYVLFILVGQGLILVGAARGWAWVRNPVFRVAHLAAIGLVALEAAFEITCPLTVWEDRLRTLAGQEVSGATFVGRWVHYLLFYNVEPWILDGCHIAFAILVLATFVWFPPRWRYARRPTHPERN